MTTKEKIKILAIEYAKENEFEIADDAKNIEDVINASYGYGELSDFIKNLGDQVHKDFKTPQIYWNEVQGDGDAYTFVSMYSTTLKNSIILDWDSKLYRLSDTEEIIEALVKVWDEAEVLEARLSLNFNK